MASTLLNNISHYWSLDETSGNASDLVGSTTLTNTNTITYSAGKIKNGADLVAANTQYFVASSFALTQAFSLSFWFKLAATGTTDYIFSSPTISSTACVEVSVRTDNKFSYSNFLAEVVSVSTLTNGIFYHIVVTTDGTNSILYLNSISDNTSSSVGHVSSNQTYNIGRRSDNNSGHMGGSVDEFGIWDRVLTQSEVSQLYNGGVGLAYPFIPGGNLTTLNCG